MYHLNLWPKPKRSIEWNLAAPQGRSGIARWRTLGLAHVGVITWLEEHHIPVDYIAGTSMGGLVGGVYATGHNAAELRQIVNGIPWDEVLSPTTPFQDLSFRRKEDARDYPNSLEFGLHKGLQLPAGLNSGQQVSLVLDKIALPYSEIESFDDLPTPFACVATDLVSGRAKVFRDGSLSLALRSTMSLPGIFTPVRTKDAIYADGGLLQNIPVEVAPTDGSRSDTGDSPAGGACACGCKPLLVRGSRAVDLGQRTAEYGKGGPARIGTGAEMERIKFQRR
jgi:NTE family protein